MSEAGRGCGRCWLWLGLPLVLALLGGEAEGATRCVRVTGRVLCPGDPSKVDSTEVALIDRDSVMPFKLVDRDDKFAKGFAETSGRFEVEGCASDTDWLFGLHPNQPEVRLQLYHFCTSDRGKEINFPEFDDTFKDFGEINLEDY